MQLSRLAWRNLWWQQRRTWITAFSIGFGVVLAVTFTGYGDYVYSNMINAGAQLGMGHVSVMAQGYQQHPSIKKRIAIGATLHNNLKNQPFVRDVLARINGQAMFASANKSMGGGFIAIDPQQEGAHNMLVASLSQGRMLSSRDGRDIVLGAKLAKNLGLKLGKKLVYTTTDVHGEIVSNIARISGLFSTGVHEIDSGMALLPIDSVRSVLGYRPDEATFLIKWASKQPACWPIRLWRMKPRF